MLRDGLADNENHPGEARPGGADRENGKQKGPPPIEPILPGDYDSTLGATWAA